MLQRLMVVADRTCPQSRRLWTTVAALLLFAVPALHPLLTPLVGVPSHLLWFMHALPVALVAYVFGVPGAAAAVAASVLTVSLGEGLFGAGYGRGADRATIAALSAAVTLVGLLIAGFALAVREVESRRRALEIEARRTHALSELGTLVASIAHELNNPLTSVAGFAELVRGEPGVPTTVRDDLDVMASEALRAAGIARQLLQLVRDGEQPRRRPFQANDVVTLALRARSQALDAHRIQVTTDLAAGLPAVTGAAGEIEQIVLNLITNAEQAMHAAAGRGRLTVRTRRDSDGVAVEVIDDGPGIAPEHVPKLFDAFFTTKPAGTGTGLGLSIARRIARAHGGDLTVQSRPGAGSTFLLRLPPGAATTTALPRGVRRSGVLPAMGAARRVLVIDDEPAIRRSVERLLARRGHLVRTAGDAPAARTALAVGDFDTVLCDVHLGPDSGVALYHSTAAERPEIGERFVFMTGDVLSPEIRDFLARTDARHLAKPFELEALLAEVELRHAPINADTTVTAA